MRKTLILLFALTSLTGMAQSDTVIWYDNSKVFKIDTSIISTDTSIAPNYLWANYHYISNDSTYQSQFIMHDSIDNKLLPTVDLINNGWRSSGTVKEFKLDSIQIGWTPEQFRDSLIYPILQSIYGNNVTKL